MLALCLTLSQLPLLLLRQCNPVRRVPFVGVCKGRFEEEKSQNVRWLLDYNCFMKFC